MINSARKAVDTILPHDPRLALQTAAAYLAIRQIPSSITLPSTATPPPLPPLPSSFNPSDGSINRTESLSSEIIQSVVVYTLLAVVLGILVFIFLRRLFRMQRQHEPNFPRSSIPGEYSSVLQRYRSYFGYRRSVELQALHYVGQPYPPFPDPNLPGFPAAYMGHARRRTHATDIDPSGRRLADPTAEVDHDGELGMKDVLPAYDSLGGPPKYFELEMPNGNQALLNRVVHRPEVSLENTNNRNDGCPSRDIGIQAPVASNHTTRQVG